MAGPKILAQQRLVTGQPRPRTKAVGLAKRRPVSWRCECGHREMLVPPCTKQMDGMMFWNCCKCGAHYQMTFAGSGAAAGERVSKRVL